MAPSPFSHPPPSPGPYCVRFSLSRISTSHIFKTGWLTLIEK